MKKTACLFLLILATLAFCADENKEHGTYTPGLSKRASGDTESDKDYVGYSDENDFSKFDIEKSNTYKMSVTPPSDWHFIPNSSCSGEVTQDGKSSVAGKKCYQKGSVPTSVYIIEMSGQLGLDGNGGAGGKSASTTTWGAYVRNKYHWIDTPQGKILTIAVGNNASATAHYPYDSSYEPSKWRIIPTIGTTASTNTATNQISYNTIFAHNPMFVNSVFQGVPAGKYTVEGTSGKDTSRKDTATWEVVQGDFYEKTSLAFDDYTDFKPQDKYYSGNSSAGKNNRGRAQTVYAVKNPGADASITLNLIPSPISKDVSVGTTNTTKQTTSYTICGGAGTVEAILDSTTLAKAIIYEYTEKQKTVTLYKVNGHSLDVPISNLNAIFKQVVVNFKLSDMTYTVTKTPSGPNNTWTSQDVSDIKNSINVSGDNYAIVVFPGAYAPDHDIGGFVRNKSNHMFIFNNSSGVIPHEMGHCLQLEDKYTYTAPALGSSTGTFTPGPDKDNLMNSSNSGGTLNKLRKAQITTIR